MYMYYLHVQQYAGMFTAGPMLARHTVALLYMYYAPYLVGASTTLGGI